MRARVTHVPISVHVVRRAFTIPFMRLLMLRSRQHIYTRRARNISRVPIELPPLVPFDPALLEDLLTTNRHAVWKCFQPTLSPPVSLFLSQPFLFLIFPLHSQHHNMPEQHYFYTKRRIFRARKKDLLKLKKSFPTKYIS